MDPATVIAVLVWTLDGTEPSTLELLRGGGTCPDLSLRFHNTPLHDPVDERVLHEMDAGPYGTVAVRIRYGAAGDRHEHEGIHLEPGGPWVLRDPDTWEPLDILLVDEHETGVACLELPMG